MNISFKYNGKIWNPKNPEKKLKQLGITWDDVEIIEKKEVEKPDIEYEDSIKLYYFLNKETGWSISSIYPHVEDKNYEPCTLETLKKLWNKENE